jgi:hypothetical protein
MAKSIAAEAASTWMSWLVGFACNERPELALSLRARAH